MGKGTVMATAMAMKTANVTAGEVGGGGGGGDMAIAAMGTAMAVMVSGSFRH